MKSFEWVDVNTVGYGKLQKFGYRGEVIEVKLTGELSLHYTRLDLASRGLITTPSSRYIKPNGKVFYFSK